MVLSADNVNLYHGATMTSLRNFPYSPGDIIKVRYETFTHYAVISDRIGEDGLPMVIDNSAARGSVSERSWTEAVAGKAVSLSSMVSDFPKSEIVSCARSFIGKVRYSILSFNCESFVRKVLGLKPTSKQVVASCVTVPSAMYGAYKVSGGNKWLTFAAGFAALAVTTKAVSE